MKTSILCTALFFGVAVLLPSPASSQAEIKLISVPMPNGIVRAQALDIVEDWAPSVVHLKGNVRVRIYTSSQNPRDAVVLQADSVDLDQTTGKITPHGNVQLTVDEFK
jgi:lipopolysaccharide assembly outer membrane protein LptD (OstA)